MIRLFLLSLIGATLYAQPLTLTTTNKNSNGIKYNTVFKVSQTYYKTPSNIKHNDFFKRKTLTALTHNISYVPRTGMELLMSSNGSYQTTDQIGLINNEHKKNLSLDSFWIGMNYMNFLSIPYSYANLPFKRFEPTLHISGGGLNNATSYFIQVSLGASITQRSYIATSWKQSFHQLHARESGWKNSSDNYSTIDTNVEYTFKINPILKVSFLNKHEYKHRNILRQYWLFLKKMF